MKLKQLIAEKLNISGTISHSYQGEDIMLWRYFMKNKVENGFFIDVGAFHPKFYNNTWLLRKKFGFRGINIEPIEKYWKLFKRYRKDDINLQCAIGRIEKEVELKYVSNNPMLSGLDETKVTKPFDKTIGVQQFNLWHIIHHHNVSKIDLLDIDVEGNEMEVLQGYDFGIRPRLILIEDDKDKNSSIYNFLIARKYKQIAHTLNNALYEDSTI